jgi:hypothetical protein
VSSQFDNFKPTGPAPYDDSGIMDLIRGNQSAIQNVPTYDDSQLRSDINSRFSDFNPNVDLSGYATNDALSSAISGLPSYQAPDLSGYATNERLQQGLNSVQGYDDSQLRSDINSRFSNFNPNVDLSGYATNDQLDNRFNSMPAYQAPDLSGYATNESVSSQFDNFKPTGPAPYDDSQLRNDIDDRFNSFQADAGVKPAPPDLWDDSVPVVNQGLDMSITPKMLQNFNKRKF